MANATVVSVPDISDSQDELYRALKKYSMSYVIFGSLVIFEILWLHLTRHLPCLRQAWPFSLIDYLVNLALTVHVGIIFYLDPNHGLTVRTVLIALAFTLSGLLVLHGVYIMVLFFRRISAVGIKRGSVNILEVELDGKVTTVSVDFIPVAIAITPVLDKGVKKTELIYGGTRVLGQADKIAIRAMSGMLTTAYVRTSVSKPSTGLVTHNYSMLDPDKVKNVFPSKNKRLLPI